jgi:hypothetical protein
MVGLDSCGCEPPVKERHLPVGATPDCREDPTDLCGDTNEEVPWQESPASVPISFPFSDRGRCPFPPTMLLAVPCLASFPLPPMFRVEEASITTGAVDGGAAVVIVVKLPSRSRSRSRCPTVAVLLLLQLPAPPLATDAAPELLAPLPLRPRLPLTGDAAADVAAFCRLGGTRGMS